MSYRTHILQRRPENSEHEPIQRSPLFPATPGFAPPAPPSFMSPSTELQPKSTFSSNVQEPEQAHPTPTFHSYGHNFSQISVFADARPATPFDIPDSGSGWDAVGSLNIPLAFAPSTGELPLDEDEAVDPFGQRRINPSAWMQFPHDSAEDEAVDPFGQRRINPSAWMQFPHDSASALPHDPLASGADSSSTHPIIQARLTVTAADDPLESEADQIAAQILRAPNYAAIPSDENEIDRALPSLSIQPSRVSADAGLSELSPTVEAEIAGLRGHGQPLPDDDLAFFEGRFGRDFSAVRIHNDSTAANLADNLNAEAFTVGADIAFAAGAYAPDTATGQHLIAHELTHILQQADGVVARMPAEQEEDEEEQRRRRDAQMTAVDQDGDTPDSPSRGQAQAVMDRELAEAASMPGVTVQRGDGPAILKPRVEPAPPTAELASPPSAVPAPALPSAQPLAAHTEGSPQRDAQVALSATQTMMAPLMQPLLAIPAMASSVVATPNVADLGESNATDVESDSDDLTALLRAGNNDDAAQGHGDADGADISPDEMVELLESERTVEEDRAEAQRLAQELRALAVEEQTNLRTEAAVYQEQLAAQAATEVAAIQEQIQQQLSLVTQQVVTTRAEMIAAATQHKSDIQARVAEEIARVTAETTQRITQAEAQLDERQADFDTFMQEQSRQPESIANQEIARAHTELDAAAQEAIAVGEAEASNYPGSDDPHPKQRDAARKVANDSAEDIRAKKPDIAQDIQSRAAGLSTQYPAYATRIRTEIANLRATLGPQMQQAATATIAELETGRDVAIQLVDQRLEIDLQALTAAESAVTARITAAGNQAIRQVQSQSRQASSGCMALAETLIEQVGQIGETTAEHITSVEEPYLPGIQDAVSAAQAQITTAATAGREQFASLMPTISEQLGQVTMSFIDQADQITSGTQQQLMALFEQSSIALQETVQQRDTAASTAIEQLQLRHDEMLNETLAELDPAIAAAREEVLDLTEQFRSELIPATDQSIAEAKKPLTDPLPDRVQAAAQEAGEPWWKGVLRAIGDIVVGFVVLVAVALVVAAVAAVFGVILTAWGAILIAGAILLVAGLAMALYHRFTQQELQDKPWYEKVLLAAGDTLGVVGLIEAFTGNDIVTGAALGEGDRTYRGVIGGVSIFSLLVGARVGIKPPSGAYTRPGSLSWGGIRQFFQGWVGWRAAPRAALNGMAGVIDEMVTAARQGVRNVREFIRKRFGEEDTSHQPAHNHTPKVDPNKLHHIFDKAEHNLDNLVKTFGGQEKAFNAVYHEFSKIAGNYTEAQLGRGVPVNVGGEIVTVRGAIVNGTPQIGTFFIP